MDRGLNDSILRRIHGCTSEGQIIFIQRWQELFNSRTLDSYQFRLFNGHWLLIEALDVIEQIKLGIINDQNLRSVIEECHNQLSLDLCFKKHNNPLLNRILKNLSVPESINRTSLLRLEYQIKHTLSKINDQYLLWLTQDLKEAIDGNSLKRVINIEELLASELINIGWSSKSLYRLLKMIFLNRNRNSFNDRWQVFIQEIAASLEEFNCFIVFNRDLQESKSQTEIDDLCRLASSIGLKILKGDEISARFPSIKPHIIETFYYLHSISRARSNDLNTAVELGIQSIVAKQAIINYYGSILSIEDNSVLVIFPNGRYTPYKLFTSSWKDAARPNSSDISLLNNINLILNSPKISDENKLRVINLFNQYRFGIESMSLETWFISLWSALESFVSTGQHSSNIQHIKKIVPPIVCNKYPFRILRCFLEDCVRCNVIPTDGTLIIRGTNRLLEVFRSSAEFPNLINLCNDYSLLKVRCSALSDCFKNNASLKKNLTNHYKILSWHLDRLYRVRNNLVHSYKVESKLLSLANHLNYYLRSTLSEIIYRMTSSSISLEELFSRLEDNYLATIEILSAKENTPYDNEVILKGPLFI